MNRLKWVLGVINALSLLLIFVWISVTLPATNMRFYEKEYDKYNIPQSIAVNKTDLMSITKYLVNYMMGKYDNLTVSTIINNEYREFFNQREKDHMVDVKELFIKGRYITYISASGVIITTMLLFLLCKDAAKVLAKSYITVYVLFSAFAIMLTVTIAANFEKAFTIFHNIFFSNDLWILNPETDLLINIVPLPFFIDISIICICILGGLIVFSIIASAICLRKIK